MDELGGWPGDDTEPTADIPVTPGSYDIPPAETPVGPSGPRSSAGPELSPQQQLAREEGEKAVVFLRQIVAHQFKDEPVPARLVADYEFHRRMQSEALDAHSRINHPPASLRQFGKAILSRFFHSPS
jgi:hypothetical protein